MKRTAALLALIVLFCSTAALAGVVVDVEQREGGTDNDTVMKGRLLLDVDRLKMVPDIASPSEPTLIYQGDEERLLIIDHSRKSWIPIDAAMMQEVAEQMQGLQAQMQQALQQLPPEQRQAAEEMMKQRMPAGMAGSTDEPMSIEVVKTDRQEKHRGQPCRAYEVRVGGAMRSVIWATDWQNVGVDRDDFQAFRDMAAFLGELMQSLPMMAEGEGPEMFSGLEEVDGFPVVVQEYEGSVLTGETLFLNPRREKLDAKEFEPPSDYRMQSMMDQMQ